MFLNFLKDIFTKKLVKKSISDVVYPASESTIKTIGILFDESYFQEREELVKVLLQNGLQQPDIEILVFKNSIKAQENFEYPVFSNKDLSWRATFSKSVVKDFIARDFDLLINYYDIEKSALMIVSNLSRAKFKVGFASVDNKLNHLLINTTAENYKVFTDELFKYLRILNKI